tara:strand:- start:2055 stop:3293 length:1239 start_codon:yes stop_codon:yes gene_type:complete
MAQIYQQMTLMSVEVFGERILNQGVEKAHPYTADGGKSFTFAIGTGLRVETKSFADFFRRLAAEYIGREAIRQRITSVSETTRATIVAQITRGQSDGLGTESIAKLISDAIFGVSRQRGALIARTETHGAANYGADGAARATGLKLRKEWVAAGDGRTRDAHRLADGQTVDMDQPFRIAIPLDQRTIGGEEFELMMIPGDDTASAGNVINCRCAVSHIVDDGSGSGVIDAAPLLSISQQSAQRLRRIGKSTGNEHFEIISPDGVLLQSGTSGHARKIEFTSEQVLAMSNPSAEVALHHNHPAKITSFSPADASAFRRLPGLSEMHAHADEASFRIARTSKTARMSQSVIERAERDAKSVLARAYNDGADINSLLSMEPHAMMLLLRRRGYVKYDFDLPDYTSEVARIINDNL